MHAGGPPVNTDISVVGDMTAIIAQATRRKAIWTTLQIAWSGVFPPHPVVFPTLQQARFMAYDAIVAGARGLFFFGGHIQAGDERRRPRARLELDVLERASSGRSLEELTDADHTPALTAPPSSHAIRANAPHIGLSAREAGGFLYLIAVRRSPTATGKVRFTGLPARHHARHRARTPDATTRPARSLRPAERSPTRARSGRTTRASTASRCQVETAVRRTWLAAEREPGPSANLS